jgi:nucleotide-binding universal stress UspA family protein
VEKRLQDARLVFTEASANLAKPAIWESGMQLPGPAIARACRAADLVVIGLPDKAASDPYSVVRPGDLAIEAGRPVLIVPNVPEALTARRIVLAWKDSREARRAMTDALPLFKRAEEVLVVEICAPEDEDDAKIRTRDVAAALARHGVNAVAKVEAHATPSAHQILRQASLIGADLIVCGAYGHSRLGEWVFGGVTRDLLAQTDRYLLFSH